MVEFTIRVFLTFLVQTTFNYATLFFALKEPITPSMYMGVITYEYSLRSETMCLLNHYDDNIKTWIVFLNWL